MIYMIYIILYCTVPVQYINSIQDTRVPGYSSYSSYAVCIIVAERERENSGGFCRTVLPDPAPVHRLLWNRFRVR